jgi:hypothetical protein
MPSLTFSGVRRTISHTWQRFSAFPASFNSLRVFPFPNVHQNFRKLTLQLSDSVIRLGAIGGFPLILVLGAISLLEVPRAGAASLIGQQQSAGPRSPIDIQVMWLTSKRPFSRTLPRPRCTDLLGFPSPFLFC